MVVDSEFGFITIYLWLERQHLWLQLNLELAALDLELSSVTFRWWIKWSKDCGIHLDSQNGFWTERCNTHTAKKKKNLFIFPVFSLISNALFSLKCTSNQATQRGSYCDGKCLFDFENGLFLTHVQAMKKYNVDLQGRLEQVDCQCTVFMNSERELTVSTHDMTAHICKIVSNEISTWSWDGCTSHGSFLWCLAPVDWPEFPRAFVVWPHLCLSHGTVGASGGHCYLGSCREANHTEKLCGWLALMFWCMLRVKEVSMWMPVHRNTTAEYCTVTRWCHFNVVADLCICKLSRKPELWDFKNLFWE